MKRTAGMLVTVFFLAVGIVYGQSASGQSGARPKQDELGRIFSSTPEKNQAPAIIDVSGLQAAVARGIVWDNYWFGYWDSKIKRMISEKQTLVGWPVSVENGKDIAVLVDDIHSEFFCSPGTQPVCSVVSDYEDTLVPAGPDPNEYETRKKQSGAGGQKISISLTPALLETVKFGSFDAPKIEKTERLFNEHVLNKEFFDALRQARPVSPSDPIRIRVANFNLDSPLIYFYVEGDPYLQTIALDSTGGRFVHLDEGRVDSPPHTKDYPHAIKRIRENGAAFTVREGKLIKEAF